MLPRCYHQEWFKSFGCILETILEAKFMDFSCYFLASFFDRFLKPSGGILGVILDLFWEPDLMIFRAIFWLRFLIDF